MSYVRFSTPIPLDAPCGTCGRLDESQYPGGKWDRWEACNDHQTRWITGPWPIRWMRRLVWFIFGRKGYLTGRPAWWTSFGWLRGRGFCRECTSGWYVFSHIDGGCAVWAANIEEHPIYSTEEIQRIVDEGDFASIPGYAKFGDQGVLRRALLRYLDMKEETKQRRRQEIAEAISEAEQSGAYEQTEHMTSDAILKAMEEDH